MSDHIDNAADEISGIQVGSGYESVTIGIDAAQEAARALADAGLLVTPEHDAAVAAKALREMRDEMSRWEGWDTRDIGHAFLSESVLDALVDAADRIEHEGGAS